MRRRAATSWTALAVASSLLLVVACTPSADRSQDRLSGHRLEVLATWSGAEEESFGRVLSAFERRTGAVLTQLLYRADPRVRPWTGTAHGVLQAVSTYEHYEGQVRGDRAERNNLKTVNGDFGQLDRRTWRTLEPLLAAAQVPVALLLSSRAEEGHRALSSFRGVAAAAVHDGKRGAHSCNDEGPEGPLR